MVPLLLIALLLGCQANQESKNRDQPKESKDEVASEANKDQISKKEKTNMNEQFFQAAERGDISKLKELLDAGIDINVADEQGRTAAMLATYANKPESVKVLIEHGINIDIQDNMQNNPFLYAGAEGYSAILKLTIEAGADPKLLNRYGGTALIPASEHGYVDVVKELLENTDVDVNHINNLGWTALLEAIILSDGGKRQQETIQLLIQHGADVNIPDSNDVSPYEHAKSRGFDEIVAILQRAGAE
ncbi:ankyrin repeat domain-containing protein [Fredinandcohnia salidurans]|uniref:Ankyrin repeat domain-containing protein n=1 Tax=Fredinandcohnia salidurans TaxID=2595041 RepID=A0ABW4MVN1_9BACI